MRLTLLILILPCFFIQASEKPLITIFTYHQKPPLIIDNNTQQGLYFDVCRHFNENSDDFRFELVYVPRKRIERMLESQQLDGMVIGVSPIWFKDNDEKKYFWTSRIFTDRDEVISLASSPIKYSDQTSLQGKVFGGVRGFYYHGINELVAKNKINRFDTANELDLFSMILNKRIDSAIVSRSTFEYVIKKNNWQDKFYVSKKPHDIFDRRILIPKNQKNIYLHVSSLINKLQSDVNWKYHISQYQ